MVRWWWFGTAVEKPEILRELQQMKADGIGGAELAFVYPQVLDDPAKNLINEPFVGPDMLDNVRYAQSEGRKLGLRIDVTLGSGWPYGGPATTLAQAATRLVVTALPLPAHSAELPKPKLADGDSVLSIALVTNIDKPSAPKGSVSWDSASTVIIDPKAASIISAAPAPRTVLFFISSHTGQVVKRAAVGAEGWVLDPFSRDAVATHLKSVGEPLLSAFGNTPPYAVFSDSLEAYGADWTPTLPAEFLKRRGYDLIPHLSELVAGGTPAADKIRHDWGQTLTELVNENYLTQINNWAIAHKTKFRSQTYGEPAVNFSSQRLAGLPEGEGPQWRAFSTLRWATSANHVFGNNVTSGETFTWLHSPVFRATPLDMKAEADIDFIMGENQLVFHGWPYSAPQVGEPGWSLYAAAVFNDHNPWHPVMADVTRYIQRVSWLLRQGQPANQIAILVPTDDAWAGFTPAHVTVTGAMQKLIPASILSTILASGYNFDFIDAEAINSVGLGTHQILIIPPTDRIPLETLRKIHDFVAKGGEAIAVGRIPTLDPSGATPTALTDLTISIPLVADAGHLAQALTWQGFPDLRLTDVDAETRNRIGFIRRTLPTADIYFVVNTSNQPINTSVTFTTNHKFAEQWDPDTTDAAPATKSHQPIRLAPYESRIFVFSDVQSTFKPAPPDEVTHNLVDLSADWNVTFTSSGKSTTQATLTDWTADPATKNYSGEAVYSRDFNLISIKSGAVFLQIEGGKPIPGDPNSPPEHAPLGPDGLPDPRVTRTGPGMHAYYEPPIREAAIVSINGKPAGSLWHPPYRLDISKLLKPGQNHIEIRVYNTALNAWSALPPHDYKPLIAKYGDRFQMQDLNKVEPIPSGILGQIHIVTQDAP